MRAFRGIYIGLLFAGTLAFLAACGGGGGGAAAGGGGGVTANPSSAVSTVIIPPGVVCPTGGVEIESGIDDNGNGVLDPAEVEATEIICNGADGTAGADGTDGTDGTAGFNSLIATSVEPAGANCNCGGVKIESGPDADSDGVLEFGEVTNVAYVCNSGIFNPSIALFNNTTYVDYIPGNSDAEASNIEDTLNSQGNLVSTFTGITAADFTAATADNQVLVIPDMEKVPDLNAAMAAADKAAISNFVNGGGTLIIANDFRGNGVNLLNGVFGFTLVAGGAPTGTISLNAFGAQGTPFAGGPATLPANNGSDTVTVASLPVGATSIYTDTSVAPESMVSLIPFGSGNIVLMGWDWFDAVPAGTQDGGWLEVLASAVKLAGHFACTGGGAFSGSDAADFDDGTFQRWSATGLWHVSAVRSVSAPNSARYAEQDTGTFDTGIANSGNLTSTLAIVLGATPSLSFDYFLANECFEGTTCGFDALQVFVSTDGFATSTGVANLVTSNVAFTNQVIDLGAFAGQVVQIRFNFDTSDNFDNSWEGAYVDNIQVLP